jgi:hypothetical protein
MFSESLATGNPFLRGRPFCLPDSSPVNYLQLMESGTWASPEGKDFPLSIRCVSQMLKALPDNAEIDKNRIVHGILSEVELERVFSNWRANLPPAGKRAKKWLSVANDLNVPIKRLEELLSDKDMLSTFRGITRAASPWVSAEKPVPAPSWTVERELSNELETLKWVRSVSKTAEAQARNEIAKKAQPRADVFVKTFSRIYFDVTGDFGESPVYDGTRGRSRGRFLDFVAPAMKEIFGAKREAVATRIKRLHSKERSEGVRSIRKRGRPPAKSANDFRVRGLFGL